MSQIPITTWPTLPVLNVGGGPAAAATAVAENRRKLRSLLRFDPADLAPNARALRSAILREGRGTANALADVLLARGQGAAHRSLIIKPVGDGCNYRCDYCFHHEILERINPMPLADVERIYRDAKATLGESVEFIWHGGEPTLAGLPYFEEAMRLQEVVFGERMANAIQTNGSRLTPDWVAFLKQNAFSVGISVDGDRRSHDLHRRSAGGRGTFDRTIDALKALRDAGIRAGVIAVITAGNSDASELYDLLADAGAAHLSTNPAAVSEGSDLGPTAEQYGTYVVSLIGRWLERGGDGPFVVEAGNFLGGLVGGWQPVCYLNGGCSSFLTIQNDGQVKGCCDRNTDPALHPETYLGDAFADGLASIWAGERLRHFAMLADENPPTCAGCEWLSMCRGGCSHQRLVAGGRLDAHDPFCRSYKVIFRFLQDTIRDLEVGD